jgi:Peptidase family M28/Fibronectin type III domain
VKSLAIAALLAVISAKNLERDVRALVSFGTRSTLSSQSDPKRGIGAARDWIKSEFDKIAATSGGRMTVELQSFTQEPGKFARITKPTVVTNVVATLRGTKSPDRVYVVSGHYDSMCGSPTDGECDAPGANDDASGVAAVLEAARVMAPREFDATIIFMAVAGEEQGLVGATYFVEQAEQKRLGIEGMFTNDIVGSTVGEDRKRVRVFGEMATPSGELARYVAAAAKKHLPNFAVWLIDRKDRFLRNGDHGPFLDRGYPAVRFTEPNETYEHQHQNVRVENGKQYGDLPQFLDYPFLANVTRVNVAALASLANAPAKPKDVKVYTRRLTNDTELDWAANKEDDLDRYEIVWRETTSPRWEHSRAVGKATSYTVKGISKDNYLFGVRACDGVGNCSPATAPMPTREIPALREELRAMVNVDQEVRKRWIKDRENPALNEEMRAVDAKHVARLREIIKEHGWPGKTLVGERASGAAWMIAQHGGSEFLHETLPLMKAAVERQELDGALYATSVDRVRIQDGQKQLYGSQFDTQGDKCEPLPIEDPEHVDERRKAVGLGPLAEYTKQLCEMYKKK